MSKSIYLINPKPDYAGYWSGDFGYLSIKGKSLFIADLAINTVAALVPSDFRVELCEEQINNIDYNHPAEFIGISGRHTQYRRMISIAKRFRDLGKTVIIGGACASLNPEDIRPYCDILFEGELEATADEFFSDLRNDTW
ncbi:MAG: radical SAM protein, partial [Deltaproteobacteria bacterium]|nr:radical SAM protein [Deltaproteobacteria bacterium]